MLANTYVKAEAKRNGARTGAGGAHQLPAIFILSTSTEPMVLPPLV